MVIDLRKTTSKKATACKAGHFENEKTDTTIDSQKLFKFNPVDFNRFAFFRNKNQILNSGLNT